MGAIRQPANVAVAFIPSRSISGLTEINVLFVISGSDDVRRMPIGGVFMRLPAALDHNRLSPRRFGRLRGWVAVLAVLMQVMLPLGPAPALAADGLFPSVCHDGAAEPAPVQSDRCTDHCPLCQMQPGLRVVPPARLGEVMTMPNIRVVAPARDDVAVPAMAGHGPPPPPRGPPSAA
jgi:hypothetical protein